MKSESILYLGKSDLLRDSGTAIVFDLSPDGFDRGFAICFRGQIKAYRNRCPHAGSQLDWIEGDFFDESGEYLICATHGAMFDPLTGKCVRGPCAGDSLESLSIQISETDLWLETKAQK